VENIPRILPEGYGVEIQRGSWPVLPVFGVMQSIGSVDENEMYRAFNMGIGMVFIVDAENVDAVKNAVKDLTKVYEIGSVVSGDKNVSIK